MEHKLQEDRNVDFVRRCLGQRLAQGTPAIVCYVKKRGGETDSTAPSEAQQSSEGSSSSSLFMAPGKTLPLSEPQFPQLSNEGLGRKTSKGLPAHRTSRPAVPNFLAPGTVFVEDDFSTDGEGGWLRQ